MLLLWLGFQSSPKVSGLFLTFCHLVVNDLGSLLCSDRLLPSCSQDVMKISANIEYSIQHTESGLSILVGDISTKPSVVICRRFLTSVPLRRRELWGSKTTGAHDW